MLAMRTDDEVPSEPAVGPVTVAFAWAGAALFAASLGWFFLSYFVRYGAAVSSGPVLQPVAVNVFLFTLFAAHHSAFARTGAKRWMQRRVPPPLERSFYTGVARLLFVFVCSFWQPVPGVLYAVPHPWALAGYAVQAAGVALTIRSAAAVDALELAGVRPVLLSRHGRVAPHVPLKTAGVYGLVRHPLYFAWALMVFGSPTMTGTRAVFALVSTLYLAVAIPWEERSLVQVFGPDYERYRRNVRWRMIPFLY
jgi:protein-S-isoprenylcysteine O-methyltransferase Ste14